MGHPKLAPRARALDAAHGPFSEGCRSGRLDNVRSDGWLVLDRVPAEIAVLDRGGAILFTNHAWQRVARLGGLAGDSTVAAGTTWMSAGRRSGGAAPVRPP